MTQPKRTSTTELLRYLLYVGSRGFGGPVALVVYIQREVVEHA